jgi:hypothetical protein
LSGGFRIDDQLECLGQRTEPFPRRNAKRALFLSPRRTPTKHGEAFVQLTSIKALAADTGLAPYSRDICLRRRL